MQPLKLIALDPEDLAIVSAHLQDSVLQVGDMTFIPSQKRFAAAVNRFDWEGAVTEQRSAFARRRTALRFDRVLAAQVQNIPLDVKGQVLALLALSFEPTTEPEGYVTLVFAGDAAIRLHVECIEAEMRDLGPAWGTKNKPAHAGGASDGDGG